METTLRPKDFERYRRTLDQELKKKEVNARKLAEDSGISPTTLYSLRNGTRQNVPKRDVLQRIASALGFTVEEMVAVGKRIEESGVDSVDGFTPYVMVSTEVAGLNEDGEPFLRRLTHPDPLPKDCLDAVGLPEDIVLWRFVVKDDAMSPAITKGCYVHIDSGDRRVRSGQVYLIRLGSELALRRLEVTPAGVVVRATNPDLVVPAPVPMESVEVFGRATFTMGGTG